MHTWNSSSPIHEAKRPQQRASWALTGELSIEETGVQHELKIWPPQFKAIREGRKTWELRKDDRGFRPGDILNLNEWDPVDCAFTGMKTRALVTYVARDIAHFGLPEGMVIMSVVRI